MAVNHVIKGLLALAVALSLTACKTEEPRKSPDTPREAAECVMESLKELDMDTLNACSDNFIRVHRNFFGLPVRREYRVFNELQQPGLFKGLSLEPGFCPEAGGKPGMGDPGSAGRGEHGRD